MTATTFKNTKRTKLKHQRYLIVVYFLTDHAHSNKDGDSTTFKPVWKCYIRSGISVWGSVLAPRVFNQPSTTFKHHFWTFQSIMFQSILNNWDFFAGQNQEKLLQFLTTFYNFHFIGVKTLGITRLDHIDFKYLSFFFEEPAKNILELMKVMCLGQNLSKLATNLHFVWKIVQNLVIKIWLPNFLL